MLFLLKKLQKSPSVEGSSDGWTRSPQTPH